MDSQGWIELARILIWPVALVVVALIFRRPLSRLLVTMTHLQFRQVKIDFGRKLETLSAITRQAGRAGTETAAGGHDLSGAQADSLPSLAADAQPVAGVLLAWSQLEGQLRTRGYAPAGEGPGWDKRLSDQALPAELTQLIQGLYELSSASAGGRIDPATLTPGGSQSYVRLAALASEWLQETAPR